MPPTATNAIAGQSQRGRPSNNNNKLGKNQYKDRPSRDDHGVAEILKGYHLKGITDRRQLSKLLLDEHGITLSESSVARRKQLLGLRSSRLTTLELTDDFKRQLILDQMAKHPAGKVGPRTVKQMIFKEKGIDLTRDYILEEMRKLDPVGFSSRGPAFAKEKRRRRLEAEALIRQLELLEGNALNTTAVDDMSRSGTPHAVLPPPDGIMMSSSRLSILVPPALRPPTAHHSGPPENLDLHQLDDPLEPNDNEDESLDGNFLSYPPISDSGTITHHPSAGEPGNANPTRQPPSSSLVPSPELSAALTLLRELSPKMKGLTEYLSTLRAADDSEGMDAPSYQVVLEGMESAALLERQLARLSAGFGS